MKTSTGKPGAGLFVSARTVVVRIGACARQACLLVALAGCGHATRTIVDIDHNVYPVISIGSQLWLGENLRTTRSPDGISLVVHSPNDANTAVPVYGYLYDWGNARRACMRGWHLPSDSDWVDLSAALGSREGGALKDTVYWLPPNTGATNTSGFAVRPAGYWNGGEFDSRFGRTAVYCSSTRQDTQFVWSRGVRLSFRANAVSDASPTGC